MAYWDAFSPPMPVILSDSMESYVSAAGEFKVRITAKVWNQGGHGQIIFQATVTQYDYTANRKIERLKNATQYVKARDGATLVLDFEGFDPTGPEPFYSTNVYAYTK